MMQIKGSSVNYDVVIAGGGLAALVSGIILGRNGYKVLLLEKKNFPFHKVCGEYVSNEILGFLVSLGFDPFKYGASRISKLRISDSKGFVIEAKLDLGGFGLSRYTMDYALVNIARDSGVEIIDGSRVENIGFSGNEFQVESSSGNFNSTFVIGAYGKRDLLDKRLGRKFIDKHTGYIGVKYHISTDYPSDEIGLYHFNGGYCGIVKIEQSKYNLCYLYKRSETEKFATIGELEEKVVFGNPILKNIFSRSQFISKTPEVINEICFDKKECVANHILYCGDSAGLITPLCGNGMAMAVNGAVILTSVLMSASPGEGVSFELRSKIEDDYRKLWKTEFSNRLLRGRQLQRLAVKPVLTYGFFRLMNFVPTLKERIIRSTHGEIVKPFSLKSAHQLHQTSRQ